MRLPDSIGRGTVACPLCALLIPVDHTITWRGMTAQVELVEDTRVLVERHLLECGKP